METEEANETKKEITEPKTPTENYKNSEFYKNGRVWPTSSGDRLKMDLSEQSKRKSDTIRKPNVVCNHGSKNEILIKNKNKEKEKSVEKKDEKKEKVVEKKGDTLNKGQRLKSSEQGRSSDSESSDGSSGDSTDSAFEYFLYRKEKRLIQRAKRQSLKEWKEKQITAKIDTLEKEVKVLKRRVKTAEGKRTKNKEKDLCFDLVQDLSVDEQVVYDRVTKLKYSSDTEVPSPRLPQQNGGISTKYNNYVSYESSSDSDQPRKKEVSKARQKWRKKIVAKGKPPLPSGLRKRCTDNDTDKPTTSTWAPKYYPLGSKLNLMAEGGQPAQEEKEITFACLICGHDGMTEAEMRSHIIMEHVEQDVCCPFCDLSGITPNEMNLHVNKVHLHEYFNSEDQKENGVINCDMDKDRVHINGEINRDKEKLENKKKSQGGANICDKENKGFSLIDPEKRARLSLDVKSMEPVLQMRQNCADNIVKSGVTAACGSAQSGLNIRPRPDATAASIIVPDINDNVEPDINCNIPSEFCCPLCHFSTSSEGDIQTHVNREHVDILSPCTPSNGSSSASNNSLSAENSKNLQKSGADHVCPICAMMLNTTHELEIHVNSKHVDILSPDKFHAVNGRSMIASHSGESSNWTDCIACPVCDQEFDDPGLLQLHVNGHFSAEQTPVQEFSDQIFAEQIEKNELDEKAREQKEFHALQAMYGMVGGTNYKKQYEKNLEKAVARGDLTVPEFHERKANLRFRDLSGIDDGHSCCKGLITKFKDYYKGPIQGLSKHWLCSAVDHFSVSYGDKGWGCGYRNFQMLLSALSAHPTYCKVVFNDRPQIPSIPKIQRLIEAAWAKGFDKQGCEQLGGKLVDSAKWIGATEIVAVLSSLKVRCQLLDFHNPSGPQGTHPKLFQWIKDYFQQPSPFKLPLYLQHQGHSRTVIGIEELKDESLRLLIFDPSTTRKQMLQFHSPINANLMRTIRRTIQGLKAKQYQIVAVTGILEDKEYEEHKVLKSERIS